MLVYGTRMTAWATLTSRARPDNPAATPAALACRAAANWAEFSARSGRWPGTSAPGGFDGEE